MPAQKLKKVFYRLVTPLTMLLFTMIFSLVYWGPNPAFSMTIYAAILLFLAKALVPAFVNSDEKTKTKQAYSVISFAIALGLQIFTFRVLNYDFRIPDTISNKQKFKEIFQVELSEDVKDIYGYGDFAFFDYSVEMTFQCDTSTLRKIIAAKKLELSKNEGGGLYGAGDDLSWWHRDKIDTLYPWKTGEESKFWKYLWYDSATQQAYYQEYSL